MDRPSPSKLQSWRLTKFAEIWKALTDAPEARRGTTQHKVRWLHAKQLGEAKRNRASRRRAKTRITKTIQRRRLAKGRNVRG